MSRTTGRRRHEGWKRRELLERVFPFASIVLLAYATLPLTDRDAHDGLVLAAAGVTAGILISIVVLPWHRLPHWAAAVPPFVGLVAIALLRQAEGGAVSGYGILVFVPTIWLALYGTRRELLVLLVGIALLFVLPILLFGTPDYPESEWRRAILFTAVCGFVGLVAHRLVEEVSSRASEAEQRARREAEREAYLRAVMDSVSEGIVAMDVEGRATFANPAAASLLGYRVDELIGERMHELIHHHRADGTPYPIEDCPVLATVRTGEERVVANDVYWRKDGSCFSVEYRATPMAVDGDVIGVVNTFLDISERLAVERMKDEFVSVVSHELRTPLTSIRGSLGLLEGGVLGPLSDEAQKMLGIAISNADRLVRLINDILDAERIESGKAPMQIRQLELAELMRQTAALLEQSASEAGVTLELQPVEARLLADPDRIVQTLVNLIGNAIKFSGSGTTVRVGGETRQGRAVIRISDQGPGIPADQRDSIFDRFSQVESSSNRAKGGSGLGLAIARGIVEQHGGRIWVESSSEEGSTFAFELPLARVAQADSDENGGGLDVLIVEDDADLAEVLAARLARHGLSTRRTETLADARAAIARRQPQVLTLDVDLPDADAAALADWLRSSSGPAASRVLVYTALDLSEVELAALGEHGRISTKGRVSVDEFERRVLAAVEGRSG